MKKLEIHYHCNSENPTQITSRAFNVDSISKTSYPKEVPYLIDIYQPVTYLDANLEEKQMPVKITYMVGEVLTSRKIIQTATSKIRIERDLPIVNRYVAPGNHDTLFAVYKTPKKKRRYIELLTDRIRVFKTPEDLKEGLLNFELLFFEGENVKREKPKIYQK